MQQRAMPRIESELLRKCLCFMLDLSSQNNIIILTLELQYLKCFLFPAVIGVGVI